MDERETRELLERLVVAIDRRMATDSQREWQTQAHVPSALPELVAAREFLAGGS